MNPRTLILVLVLGIITVAPGAAEGQNALDNNLQRGSGGVNAPVRRQKPGAYQDALITGNVGGLHRFRGNVDYRAPGEFTGNSSGDSTFDFRLRSLPATPNVNPNYQRPDFLPRGNSASLLLRQGSGVTAGEVTGQQQRFGGGPARRDDATTLSIRRASRDSAIGGAVLPLDLAATQDRSIAIRQDDEGELYEVVASPLRGVRQVPIGRALQLRDEKKGAEDPGATEKARPVWNEQVRRINDQVTPLSGLIGERLMGGRTRDARPDAVRAYRYNTLELEEAVLRPSDAYAVEPGTDAYYDLLRRVSGGGREGPYRPQQADRLGAPDKKEAPIKTLEQRLEEQAARRDKEAGAGENEQAAFEGLLRRLSYDVTLRTLASGSGTTFDKSLARAETLMSEGRYFEAEAEYARAMGLPQSTPMAMVGQVHAQVGAGLYTTGAQGLRRLFDDHPELIAARYEPPVLPGEERMAKVIDDVDDLAREGKAEATLLAAYLAYQRGERPRVAELLDSLGGRDANDPLVPLLRKIWSEGEPAAAQEEAPVEPEK